MNHIRVYNIYIFWQWQATVTNIHLIIFSYCRSKFPVWTLCKRRFNSRLQFEAAIARAKSSVLHNKHVCMGAWEAPEIRTNVLKWQLYQCRLTNDRPVEGTRIKHYAGHSGEQPSADHNSAPVLIWVSSKLVGPCSGRLPTHIFASRNADA